MFICEIYMYRNQKKKKNVKIQAQFLFGPKGPPRFFAHENYVGQGARIFTIFFWFLYI